MPSISEDQSGCAIAIIGLSCRFPGDASGPSEFWELLKDGRSGYSPSTDRYNAKAFHHPAGNGARQNVIPTEGGYFIKQDPYVFDAAFFNITATEAMALDPRQRLAMEVAYEAVENAGLPLQKIAGTQTACFMGSSMSDYRDAVARDFAHFPKYHILGVSDEMISNRISHFLDIHGPSATIQTACSSSLVATHLACQSLRSGESEMALAGGVGLILGTDGTMHLNNLGFLNPEGHSRSFDEHAGGYGRGEGCGVLLLKRLDAARRDGDNVRAVILASGVNSDGWTQGVTMPSMEAQAALIKHVYESNGLDYSLTQYVEAHGTGTKAGDPVETGAIYRTIGQTSRSTSRKILYIGSVKSNIGHLEAAAGVASIIKGVLALERGLIPPNINFSKANPAIPLAEWNMAVPTKLIPWPAAHTKRMSISGFGMGGTNAHLVIEAFDSPSPIALSNNSGYPLTKLAKHIDKKRLFVFSSHDKAGFTRIADALVKHLDILGSAATNPAYLAALAHTLATARSGLTWKAACLVENVVDLREQLLTTVAEARNASRTPSSAPRIGFVFTGQGAQWACMGIEMLEHRIFRDSISRSAEFLKDFGCDWDPITELSKGQSDSRLGLAAISQPICTVLQIALIDELRSWGVVPCRVVGHSSGEIAAAYTIGALSHRDALAVAYFRGTASSGPSMRKGNLNGGMMAVGCSREEAQKLMAKTKLHATVACVNSPSNVTLSGDVGVLEALRTILDERGVFARRLKVNVAYHSSHMHLCSAEYYASIADVGVGGTRVEEEAVSQQPITMVSSVTGNEVDSELLGPYYWVQNLISPVLFTDAVKELVCPADAVGEKAVDLLVEVGPHSALGGPVEQILSSHGINMAYTSMIVRGQSAIDTSLALAAELFLQGVAIKVTEVNGDVSHKRLLTDLPAYQWNHSESFRAESRVQKEIYAQKFPTSSLLGAMLPRLDETERVWRNFIRLNDEPWLRSHTVGATVLLPGAGMISIVLEAAQQIVDPGHHQTPLSLKLRDISFLAALALPEDTATEIIVHMRPHLLATSGTTPATWWEFTLSSCAGSAGQVRSNCRGLISVVYRERRSVQMAEEDAKTDAFHIAEYHRILSECPASCSKDLFYDRMAKSALPYGEVFQGVEKCHPGDGKTCYEVKVVDIGETFSRGKLERPFLIHAATLDAVLQGWLGSTCSNIKRTDTTFDFGFDKPMLPMSIRELEIAVDMPGNVGYMMPGLCRSRRHGFNDFSANLCIFDKDLSRVLLSIEDFRTSPLEMEDEDRNTALKGKVFDDGLDAPITSEVHWDYSLDIMEPSEISQVMSMAQWKTADERLSQLLHMSIHQRPSAEVVELVPSLEDLKSTFMSRLVPTGVILPAQIRYAVANGSEIDWAAIDNGSSPDIVGQPFALDASEPFSQERSADIILVPQRASLVLGHGLENILERLVRVARSGALLIIAGPSLGEVDSSPLAKCKGIDVVAHAAASTGYVTMYRYTGCDGQQHERPGRVTNGSPQKVLILEPMTPSAEVQRLSDSLQVALKNNGYSFAIKTGLPAPVTGSDAETADHNTSICISLLEIEKPMLDSLLETDFQSLQKLMMSYERLLWLTWGDSPSFGIIDGLARCVNNEIADNRVQVLHLSSEGMQHGAALVVRILQSSQTTDNEFRERDSILQVQRIYRSPQENKHIHNHLEDSTRMTSIRCDPGSAGFQLQIGKPGFLDSLHFIRDENATVTPLAEDELEIEVKATGVNFRDIMASMGLVPVVGLGAEASGVVLRAGSRAAKSFTPGDRVSTMTMGGAHATKTRCDFRVTAKLPDTMSFEEGAAAPTVHATAYYALVKLAKLQRGQSVLIHAGAGGVGQSAVQLAKHLGLDIFVTVGTEDKRRFLKEQCGIAEDHIFNSRDSSFSKGVHRMTNGRGVDCVLNSLSGELLRVSWDCIATFGTFVEIGLRDITDNMRLDMRPFAKSATFTFFDIPTLIQENPAALGQVLNDVFDLLRNGILHVPYPLTVYPIGQVEDAFRIMQQGKHRGKIVLSFSEEDKLNAPVVCKASESLTLDPNATYLFVGGLGGLGRSLARELVSSGARYLAFLSRSGETKPEARGVVDELVALGAHVKVFRSDVADEGSFLAVMEQCSQQLPPIKGVVQMAMVLRDVVLENMSHGDWTVGLRPKVQGTWNLHQYFDHTRPLDFMIFCSSISGIAGNPGQAQYDAGNSYQDALAQYRRAQGLTAVSVNLGIMLDVGIIAESVAHNFKVWEDMLGIKESSFHALIKSVINGQQRKRGDGDRGCPDQLCTGLGTGDMVAAHHMPRPPWFEDARFGPLAVATSALSSSDIHGDGDGVGAGASLASTLSAAASNKDHAGAAAIITSALVKKIADILRIPPSEVDPGRPLYAYGVDSLVALEVRNWITRELKASVGLLDILAPTPIELFADQLAQKSKLVAGVSLS